MSTRNENPRGDSRSGQELTVQLLGRSKMSKAIVEVGSEGKNPKVTAMVELPCHFLVMPWSRCLDLDKVSEE